MVNSPEKSPVSDVKVSLMALAFGVIAVTRFAVEMVSAGLIGVTSPPLVRLR